MTGWPNSAAAARYKQRRYDTAAALNDGRIDQHEHDRLLALYYDAARAGRTLPLIDIGIEDLRELGRFARPIPAHKLDAVPACQRPTLTDQDADRSGTRAGYRAHLKAGEPPCAPCIDAERDYNQSRKVAA